MRMVIMTTTTATTTIVITTLMATMLMTRDGGGTIVDESAAGYDDDTVDKREHIIIMYWYVDVSEDLNTYKLALVRWLLRRLPTPSRTIVGDASQITGSRGATNLLDHSMADALRSCSARRCLLSS